MKLLVLLRDPVERAYSAHAHELARGYETEAFERALELEEERLAGEAGAADRRPGLPQPPTSTTATWPAAATPSSWSGWRRCSAGTGCTWWTAAGSSPSPSRSYDGVLEFLGLPHSG